MGLDMYLIAGKHISGAAAAPEAEREYYNGLVSVGGATDFVRDEFTNYKSAMVEIGVGYWRKANAIHKYFVDSCQDGMDDCRRAYVQRDVLEELRDFCKQLIDSEFDPELCAELLPPSEGFFFGSYEIDDWYKDEVKRTYEMISYLLFTVKDDWSFYYQASW